MVVLVFTNKYQTSHCRAKIILSDPLTDLLLMSVEVLYRDQSAKRARDLRPNASFLFSFADHIHAALGLISNYPQTGVIRVGEDADKSAGLHASLPLYSQCAEGSVSP